MMKDFTGIAILTFALLGCTTNEVEVVEQPYSCLGIKVYEGSYSVTIDTGILRDKPVDVISKELFLSRLESSSIWHEMHETSKVNAHSDNGLLFPKLNGSMNLHPGDNGSITEIRYRRLDPEKRKSQGHNLSEQEKQAMIEVINIVIDDKTKSTETMEELYQKYLVKLKNNDTLGGGLLHAYVLYDGLQFEFWGVHRPTHKRAKCVESNFTELVIQ